MRITKYGHSCLLIEENGVRILTDPGVWSAIPPLTTIAAVLITHEHEDHCSVEKLKPILEGSPNARVITHAAVSAKLSGVGIQSETIEPGSPIQVDGVSVESVGTEHAVIYETSPCRNTGYLIAEKLFAPGDALHDVPNKKVRVLALPTGGPWMKVGEAVEYAKKLSPEIVFPIHDAMYIEEYRNTTILNWMTKTLTPDSAYKNLADGESLEC